MRRNNLLAITVLLMGAPVFLWPFAITEAGPQSESQSGAAATGAIMPTFEVASIKPNKSTDNRFRFNFIPPTFQASGLTTKFLIKFAYNLKDNQLSGGPGWIDSQRYDIEAKEDDALVKQILQLPHDQWIQQNRLAIQSLLADRFKLRISHQSKELTVYALVAAKTGPKVKPTTATPPGGRMGLGQILGTAVNMNFLIEALSGQPEIAGRVLLDQTGLTGNYDITLKWTSEGPGPGFSGPGGQGPAVVASPDASGPSLFTALEEQLGLRLESKRASVDTVVIDHIEEPTPN